MLKISPFLWFDHQAEEAAKCYVGVFPNSRILRVTRYGEPGPGPAGAVMTVEFELDGLTVTALNGGPLHYHFTEAFSFSVMCDDQAEVDRYWTALLEGGVEDQCGWLKDRFGLSWQIVPAALLRLLGDADRERAARAMQAMFGMRKLDIAALEEAAAG